MAIVQNVLIGSTSKSVGNATFSKWKGINTLRSKPTSVANPQTLGQTSQRNRFALIVSLYRLIAGAVKVGYKERAIKQSEYNAFTSDNTLPGTEVDNAGIASLNLAGLHFSRGTITPTPVTNFGYETNTQMLTVEWDDTQLQPGQSADDKAVLVMVSAAGDLADSVVTNISRTAGTATAKMDAMAAMIGDYYYYLFFYNPFTRKASDSLGYSN